MKTIFYPFLAVLFLIFLNINISFAQETNIKIQEVYGDKTQEFVLNDPERLSFCKDIIENRIKVIEMPSHEKEDYAKLSTVPLLNKYNPDLKRDVVFDPDNFNPLKYSFSFSSNKLEYYRVDNTDYVIVIKPQSFK